MIIIADSGSTKIEWCLVDKQGKKGESLFTSGINPYFQTEKEIKATIEQELRPLLSANVYMSGLTAIYFYGAGCAFPDKNRQIVRALQTYWNVPVEVYSDLLAAAHALCEDKAGIPCILGTGSNSCLYNGKEIQEQISPLGFILGDEGSGAVLGRRLVSDCLKSQLPKEICRKFMETYQLTPALILEHVYRNPFPNRFLASLAPFLREYIWEEAVYKIVYESFQGFFHRNIMQYTDCENYPVHFVGSIAYYFQNVLQEAIKSFPLQMGKIEKTPMNGLINYYMKNRI